MNKLKTNKSISKRFRITKNGKVLRGQSFKRHLNAKKSSKQKRSLSGMINTTDSFAKRIIKRVGVRVRKTQNKSISK